MLNALSENDRR